MGRLHRSLGYVAGAILLAAVVRGEPGSDSAAASPVNNGALSPRLSAVLRDSLPKFTAPVPAQPDQKAADPQNAIVRLPRYIVHDRPLPEERDVLTTRGRAALAVPRYLGSPDGLDRGILNRFTLADGWKKIPVLGLFPFLTSQTNEERALEQYERDERAALWADLLDLEALGRSVAKPAATSPTTAKH